MASDNKTALSNNETLNMAVSTLVKEWKNIDNYFDESLFQDISAPPEYCYWGFLKWWESSGFDWSMLQNDIARDLKRSVVTGYTRMTSYSFEQERQIVMAIRDRVRAELGLLELSTAEKAAWKYEPAPDYVTKEWSHYKDEERAKVKKHWARPPTRAEHQEFMDLIVRTDPRIVDVYQKLGRDYQIDGKKEDFVGRFYRTCIFFLEPFLSSFKRPKSGNYKGYLAGYFYHKIFGAKSDNWHHMVKEDYKIWAKESNPELNLKKIYGEEKLADCVLQRTLLGLSLFKPDRRKAPLS